MSHSPPRVFIERALLTIALVLATAVTSAGAEPAEDPLPSWNDGPAKGAILDFVARVTRQGGPDFVPLPERIATIDNDGTLWCEQPVYVQAVFALDRARVMA